MESTALRVVVSKQTPAPTTVEAAILSVAPNAAERITVVHIASGDLWAGAEVQLFNLACVLDADPQVRLFVILLNPGLLARRLHERGVSVQVFDEGKLNAIRILARVYRFLRQVRPDIVHTHREKENVIGAIAARLAGAKSVRTVHGVGEHPPGSWQLHRRLQKHVDRLCAVRLQDKVIAVSCDLGEKLRTRMPQAAVDVVENGLDIERLRDGAGVPVDLPGTASAVKIAFVARLVPVKRVDVFLEVAALLISRHPGLFQFYIFGDGPLLEQTRRHIGRLGLEGKVFLMGFRDPLAPYLARMNMLFITSDHEGLPMNMLEAMGLEVPIVAHAVGGIPSVLDEGRCGTLIYGQHADAYAEAAQAYLENRAVFMQKAQEGLALARARYSAIANARAFISLYAALRAVEE